MIPRVLAVCVGALIGTLVVTALLGQCWRFVTIRGQRPHRPLSWRERFSVRAPGPRERAEKGERLARLDVPFAALFLGGSLIVLATRGFGGIWWPTFALWLVGAVVRWLTPGPAAVVVRCGTVAVLAIEAVLVVGLRGAAALPQAIAYVVAALVGGYFLYRAGELPVPTTGPRTPSPTGRRPSLPRAFPPAPAMYDTLPATQAARPLAQVTPISYARRNNPQRVRPDEGEVLTPPYYPQRAVGAAPYAD